MELQKYNFLFISCTFFVFLAHKDNNRDATWTSLYIIIVSKVRLEFEVAAVDFVPRQSALCYFLEEWIWVEFFYVEDAVTAPFAGAEHIGTSHGRNAGGVTYTLGAGFFVGCLVAAVVVDIVGLLLTVLDAADTATDGGVAGVVAAEGLRSREYGFEELDRHDLLTVVVDRVDACHADVLDHTEVCEIFLTECHPETGTFDACEVFHQALQLFVVEEVRLFWTDFWVVQGLVDAQRVDVHPFAVLPVFAALSDFADIDFWVEVGGECFVVVAGVAVYDIEIVHLVEVMFSSVGGVDGCAARVEAAAEDSAEAGFLEAVLVGPLP